MDTSRLRLELSRSRGPALLLLGLVLAAIVALLIMFKNIYAPWPWEGRETVRVVFDDVKGVRPGTQQQVRVAGVRVGVIDDVQLANGRAIASLSIEPRYGPVYRDARVRLRPATGLQDMYVQIEDRGHPSAGKLDEDRVLEAARTRVPVDVSDVLNTFDPGTRTAMSRALRELRIGLAEPAGQQLEAAFVELAPFLQVTADLSRTLDANRGHVRDLITNFADLTTALSRRDRDLTEFVSGAQSTLSEIDARDGAFGATLEQLPPTLQTLRRTLAGVRRAQPDLDKALMSLRPTAGALASGLTGLQDASREGGDALRALQPSLRPLRRFSRAVPPTSAPLRDSFTDLAPQAPQLDRFTKALLPCKPIIARFFHVTMSTMKYADANAVVPRGVARFGASSLNTRGLDRNWVLDAPSCAAGRPAH